MTANEIRAKFLKFFEARGHAILPSSSLVTTDDKGVTNSTLFNTAGMQPLIPYLLGDPHPSGKQVASAQKCLRTVDIDDVGDNTHNTFFEMLGNWSLGDYFKEEAIKWSFEFLTSKEDGLGLDPNRLYITVFEGDENAPRDDEAFNIWKQYVPEHRIYFMGAKSNWWAAGDNGPCGPDTEMFYDITPEGLGDLTKEQYIKADDERKVIEIWNDVFMQYQKEDGKVVGKLKNNNVDTGAGLERLSMIMQNVGNVYYTDLFRKSLRILEQAHSDSFSHFISTETEKDRSIRIILDHTRAILFLAADGIIPSNKDRGYVMRKLIRRQAVHMRKLVLGPRDTFINLLDSFVKVYVDQYPEVFNVKKTNYSVILDEMDKFSETVEEGYKEFEKWYRGPIAYWGEATRDEVEDMMSKKPKIMPGLIAFRLFSTYGFPIELTSEIGNEKGIEIDMEGFNKAMKEHQKLSQSGAGQKFKGGLADDSEEVVKYHTATHLLNQALHEVLGEHVEQRGSNITAERLRFDFSHPQKLTEEEKKKVEEIVNEKIKANLPVKFEILPKVEAEQTGARHMFNEKYGDEVKVYYIGDSLESAYSKEFCGGPHVENTGVLGTFKITKEEAVAAGIRRIKGVLV
ncbi:MAG: alanine--tRNA ligase [Candidatus Pacebacteria bacterium]|nr:alanine--tRNA ligase [Candidatus Paceibacterota bacterium]